MKEILEGDPEAYYDSAELLEPLKLMYRSLMETHDDGIANGRLLDVIRQARPPPYSWFIAAVTHVSSHVRKLVCSCSNARKQSRPQQSNSNIYIRISSDGVR